MPKKKEEWEIRHSRENPEGPRPENVITAVFAKSALLVGKILDGRFLIEKDLTPGITRREHNLITDKSRACRQRYSRSGACRC